MKFERDVADDLLLGRPPHGGRGLKFVKNIEYQFLLESSSTRGTWIEIRIIKRVKALITVVLHTGDVD